MTEHYENIGAWLSSKRREHGYTQQQIADKLGMAKSMVSRWESGKRKMYAGEFLDYCDAVGITNEELKKFTDEYRKN